jgi:hypothetical protein
MSFSYAASNVASGTKDVTLNGTQRALDRGTQRVTGLFDLRDHRIPQELGRSIGGGGVHRNLSFSETGAQPA